MNIGKKSRLAYSVSFVSSILPLIWFCGVLALALRVPAYLGHWPKPGVDDPNLFPFIFHHGVLAWAFYLLVATLLAAPAVWDSAPLGLPGESRTSCDHIFFRMASHRARIPRPRPPFD